MDTDPLYPFSDMGTLQSDTMCLQSDGGLCFWPGKTEDMSPRVVYDLQSLDYDMSGDKHMYLFMFDNTPEFMRPQRPRPGAGYDEDKFKETFRGVGFTVHEPFENYTRRQVMQKLKDVCDMDHRNTSCVAVVFLAYGNTDGKLYAADKPFKLKDAVNSVLHASSLAGKAKLFVNHVTTLGSGPLSCEISLVGREEIAGVLQV